MLFPKKKWLEKETKRVKSEGPLQSFTDDELTLQGIFCFRIPDNVFTILKRKLSDQEQITVFKALRGRPDNLCLIPVSEEYCLAMNLELKSNKGKLHGKQVTNSRRVPWVVARSVGRVSASIVTFKKRAESIRKWLETSGEG